MLRGADLWATFTELSSQAGANSESLPAKSISGRTSDYVAKGASGEPIILLHVSNLHNAKLPLHLRYIRVEYAQKCRIKEDGQGPIDGQFVVIRCAPDTPSLFELFIRTADAVVASIPNDPTATQIESCVRQFVELFRKLQEPSSRTIKGLWAELLVIATSANAAGMVSAWHADVREKFDFSFGSVHLEVKASELSQRIHEFSIAQLDTRDGATIFIASLLLRRSSGGVGVFQLADRIAGRLAGRADLITKLWSVIVESLGAEFTMLPDVTFDDVYAESSLRFLRAEVVPCVQLPLAREILDVRLKVDVGKLADEQNAERVYVEQLIAASRA